MPSDYEKHGIQRAVFIPIVMVGRDRPAVVPSFPSPRQYTSHALHALTIQVSNRRTSTEMEETEISDFISPMYTPSCLLILTTPAAHVPVQAGRSPLETVGRCRTQTVPDVCNHAHISIGLKKRVRLVHSHHDAVFHLAIHVQGKKLSRCILLTLNLARPQQNRDADEHRVVGDVSTDAQPTPKAVRNVPRLSGIRRARRNVPIGVEMARRIKMRRTLAVDLGVAVQVPHVWNADRALRDEHPFVPVVLGYLMWQPHWSSWPPSQDFLDHGIDVGQGRTIGEGWRTRAAHNCVELGLCTGLCLWVCKHRECPPSHYSRYGPATSDAAERV